MGRTAGLTSNRLEVAARQVLGCTQRAGEPHRLYTQPEVRRNVLDLDASRRPARRPSHRPLRRANVVWPAARPDRERLDDVRARQAGVVDLGRRESPEDAEDVFLPASLGYLRQDHRRDDEIRPRVLCFADRARIPDGADPDRDFAGRARDQASNDVVPGGHCGRDLDRPDTALDGGKAGLESYVGAVPAHDPTKPSRTHNTDALHAQAIIGSNRLTTSRSSAALC